MDRKTFTINVAGKEVQVETGRIATQTAGSMMLTMGGTTLLATVSVDSKDTELDYFPLSVEYLEKLYASGNISGSRFRKREGFPTDEAVIKARQVDHSIRSLFPKSFKRPVSVILTVLAYDGVNDPEVLTVLASSLALLQTGIPFYGPASSVVVCVDDNDNIIINPEAGDREKYKAEFVVASKEDRILNLEGWGKEVSEEVMDKILDEAVKVITDTNKQQLEFINSIEKSLKIDTSIYNDKPVAEDLINKIIELKFDAISSAMYQGKEGRNIEIDKITEELYETFEKKGEEEEGKYSKFEINIAVDYIKRKALRKGVIEEKKRASGRKLDEIREMTAEIDVLPTVHGSAVFSRELTQSLSIVTIGPKSDEQILDEMEGESTKTFMHHYNMPPYANGEVGRYSFNPGRREIGHGAIGENALKHMIPSEDEFPYTIRAVSEIMSSNGSTSMAATCAASMAMMAAGIPMKEAVAGIGVGLISENEESQDNYNLLLDIEGIEDFYGDMDFKVCGTKNGITAIQYENKVRGVKVSIMKEALRLAKTGRAQVLEVMNKAISKPKDSLPENAPKVLMTRIPQDRIGELIGPGGKNIKALIEEATPFGPSKADIAIEDDGRVAVYGSSTKQVEFLKTKIESMFEVPEIGKIYEGVVDRVVNFGAFINVSPSITGLCHVSELSDKFVKDATQIIKPGQKVKVKLMKITDDGKLNFTMKGIDQK